MSRLFLHYVIDIGNIFCYSSLSEVMIMVNDRLKMLLTELDISQRQFAMKINLDAGYFSRIMQGKVNPPDRILLLIENVFNVNKNWLENGEGEMFATQGITLAKKQVLESIDTLTDEQVNAVSSFIKYFVIVLKIFSYKASKAKSIIVKFSIILL